VNEASIRHWCEALGDSNPAYVDESFAADSVWGGVIAPPTMLQAWTLHDRRQQPPAPSDEQVELRLGKELADAGYVGVVATNCEQRYLRALRPGDRLTSTATITAVSDLKKTGLGDGYFVTTTTEFTDEAGEVVGTMLFRVLRYRAGAPKGERQAPPRPAITSDPIKLVGRSVGPRITTTRMATEIQTGDELPALEIPLTPTLIICGAIASNDFNVLHHDRDRAVAAGSPDIFMNILTTNGLVGRFLSEWAGPEAALEELSIRLGAPNYPYDTFVLTGSIADVDAGRVRIEISGRNATGEHVSGTATMAFPR
jgi:acyl dehydratase